MKQFLLIFLIIFSLKGFSQQIELDGQYNGENLYVMSSSNNDGALCITNITVNGKETDDNFNSSSFEIDLSQLELEIGTPVNIIVFHKAGCIPKIINPEAIKFRNNFTLKMIDISRKGVLYWSIEGDAGEEPFNIEQYRWNKWVKVGEVRRQDSIAFNKYSYKIQPLYGENHFRICQIDKYGNKSCSPEEKYRTVVKEIFLLADKVGDELEFTSETLYEIYTEEGEFLKSGTASEVDVSELPKGNYWVNYDNKTELFVKK